MKQVKTLLFLLFLAFGISFHAFSQEFRVKKVDIKHVTSKTDTSGFFSCAWDYPEANCFDVFLYKDSAEKGKAKYLDAPIEYRVCDDNKITIKNLPAGKYRVNIIARKMPPPPKWGTLEFKIKEK